jgi:hypothetical protein
MTVVFEKSASSRFLTERMSVIEESMHHYGVSNELQSRIRT